MSSSETLFRLAFSSNTEFIFVVRNASFSMQYEIPSGNISFCSFSFSFGALAQT
jgi:hypothetical protein